MKHYIKIPKTIMEKLELFSIEFLKEFSIDEIIDYIKPISIEILTHNIESIENQFKINKISHRFYKF